MRPFRRVGRTHTCRGLGGQYRACVREGVFGKQYTAAAERTGGQSRCAVVRGTAQRLREADSRPEGWRLFRCHSSEQCGAQIGAFHRRRRCQECGAPRRYGDHGAFCGGLHRAYPGLLFPGRGQWNGRHRRMGSGHAPGGGRSLRPPEKFASAPTV